MSVTALRLPNSIFAKTPISSELEVDEIDALFTTYKLMLQLWVEFAPYSDSWVFLAEMEQPATQDFDAKFFIDNKLRETLAFDLPDLSGGAVQQSARVCKRYKLKYGVKTAVAGSMQLVDEFYHRGSGFVKVPVAEPLELDVPYATIAYTSKLSAIAGVKYFDGASTANVNFLDSGLWGNRAIAYNTITLAGLEGINEILIPPNIKFELYKYPVEYTEEAEIFGALLGAESLKSFGYRLGSDEHAFDEGFDEGFDAPD